MAIYQYLTLYDDFDVPLDGAGNTTCSTNPAHTRPYLIQTLETASSEVNFLEGRSTIGQVNILVLDKRTVASDQTTGWLTAILANTNGENKLVGRRITLDARDGAGTLQYVIFDGVINEIGLNADNVTYTIITRDVRDNERAQPLFNLTNGSTSIFPPGIRDGYGKYVRSGGATALMVPAAPVMGGRYKTLAGITGGQIRLDHSAQSITPDMYHEQLERLNVASARYGDTGTFLGYCYPNVIVRWRDEATHGAWNTLTNMPVLSSTYKNVFETDSQIFAIDLNADNGVRLIASAYDLVRLFSDGTGSFPLPANNQRVEVQVLSNLPPSELYPFWWDGNLGQLLKDIYDGLYSYTNPKIRYNSAAMTAFIAAAPNSRVRLTEQVEDMRPWVEENIYKPMGYAPAINQNGEVVPVSMFLPDASITPITLDNTNCRSAQWKHTSSDSVTKVTWKWKSEGLTGPLYKGNWWKPPIPIVTLVQETDREDTYLSASAVYVGTKEVIYEPATFRDVDPPNAYDAAQTNSTARQAQKVGRQLIDRLRYGGQHIMVKGARRSDSSVQGLKVGDWVICGFSNLPDYGTHVRGMSRLAQVISIKDVDPISRDMELLDSGPSGAPLSIPTIGSVTVSGQNTTVVLTAVAGAEVALEYAINASQPTSGSNLWQRAARGPSGTYSLPILPVGVTVWIRARSEAIGKRPSAWATAVSTAIGGVAYPYTASITIDAGIATAKWDANEYMLGARVYYAITSFGLTPPSTLTLFFDVDATLGTKDLGAVTAGDTVSVEVEGWTGFTSGAVSGTQGRKTIANQVTYALNPEAVGRPTVQSIILDATGQLVITIEGDDRTKSIKAAVKLGSAPTSPEIRAGTNINGRSAVFTFGPYSRGNVIYVGAFAYSAINSTGQESIAGYGQTVYDLPAGIIANYTPFASSLQPVGIVATLPVSGAFDGQLVILTTDHKLYRWNGAAWTAAVPAPDITGQITTAQIAAGAVTATELGAAAVIAGKIAANAVTSAKIAIDAVDITKISDASAGRSGNFFNETFDKLTLWDFSAGTSTPTLIGGGTSGVNVARMPGYTWAIWSAPIPFNPLRIYRFRARYRATTNASIPANALIYMGVISLDQAGNPTNSNSGYDYILQSGATTTVAAGWVELESWVKGATKAFGAGSGAPSTNPRAPSALGINTTLVKPMFGFNYPSGNGVFELDYFVIEEMSDVPGGQITALTITAAELAAASVVAGKIAAGTIVAADIAADTITAGNIAANAITSSELAANSVVAGKIAAGTIVAADIAADTITASQIAAGAISSSELATGSVIAGKIAALTIVAGDIAASTITGAKIAAATITAANIAADTITAGEIAAGAITTTELAANAVTAAKIAAGTITGTEIAAGAITAAKISAGSITANEISINSLVDVCNLSDALSTAHAVSSGSDASFDWPTEDVDSAGMHIPSFLGRITLQHTGGVVFITAKINWSTTNTTGNRILKIFKNGAAFDTIIAPGAAVASAEQIISTNDYNPTAGDYYFVGMLQTSGSTINVINSSFKIAHLKI